MYNMNSAIQSDFYTLHSGLRKFDGLALFKVFKEKLLEIVYFVFHNSYYPERI